MFNIWDVKPRQKMTLWGVFMNLIFYYVGANLNKNVIH